MSNDNSLEQQLEEKEQLVAALTERLELAAEQLDRLQRSGADRGSRASGGGGGFPAELVEKHESLVDDLQQAVQQWNEMQAGVALGNLERQMADLRDLISSNPGATVPGIIRQDDELPNGSHPGSAAGESAREDADGEVDSDRWAALKSYLLDEDEEAPQPEKPAEPAAETEIAEESIADLADVAEVSESDLILSHGAVEAPEPIDENEIDVDILREAVDSRDAYIVFLLRKLRRVGSRPQLPANWEELDGNPESLCRQVEELQSQLTEALRLSELEHSLERARLGREESRIKQMEETARRAMLQLGLDPELDGEEEIKEKQREAGSGNRWLKMLGITDDDDEYDDE